jgi:hypothetical protein
VADAIAMPRARPAHRGAGDWMALRGVAGQVLGRGARLVRPPALVLRPRCERRAARDPLEASARAAAAHLRVVRVDNDVPDVAGVAGGTLDDPAVQDQPAAHAGRHDHAHHVVLAPAGPAPVLGGHQADCVVVHPDRDAAELFLQPGAQRERAPGGHVQRRYDPGRPVHRAAAPDADAGQRSGSWPPGFVEYPADQGFQGAPHLLAVQFARGRNLRPGDHPAAGLDHGGGQLGATDVDGKCRARLVHAQSPKMRITPTCT